MGPDLVDSHRHAYNIDLVSWKYISLLSISAKVSDSWMASFMDQEIQHVMFVITNDKSPELDGFPSAFFKIYWPILGSHVTQAVNQFLTTGSLLKKWNRSLLVLIPKTESQEEAHQLRPISLCNIVYKYASKCLVIVWNPCSHIKLVIFKMHLSLNDKWGTYNILISHKLLHTIINKQGTGPCHFFFFFC